VDGDQLRVRFIVELDGICSVSSNLVSAECLTSGDLKTIYIKKPIFEIY